MKTMKALVERIAAAGRDLFRPTKQMANAVDCKTMLYKLLGLQDDADETAVNERYTQAMDCDAGASEKKLADEVKAANEAKVAAETLLANEKAEAAKLRASATAAEAAQKQAEADLNAAKRQLAECADRFANERKERVKLALDAAVAANKITGAKRKEYEAEFANAATFDATLAKLNAEKGTMLPNGRQAGTANVGLRRGGVTPGDAERLSKIQEFANEEAKKPIYRNLPDDARYARVMLAVQQAHPELYEKAS